MTPIDCMKVSNPALTNPKVNNVVAVKDCTKTVIKVPHKTALPVPPVN